MKIPALPSLPVSVPPAQLGRVGLVIGSLAFGQWILSDVGNISGGGIGFVVAGAGLWWLFKPVKPGFEAPSTVQGWVRRCRDVLDQFDALEEGDKAFNLNKQKRLDRLDKLIERSGPQSIAFVRSSGGVFPEREEVKSALMGSSCFNLSWASPLPLKDQSWTWPKALFAQDFIVYVLPLPLRASDLLWLEQVPIDQPSWVMVSCDKSLVWADQLRALQAQLPGRWENRILRFSEDEHEMRSVLKPVRKILDQSQKNIDLTRLRLLSKLHSGWQADLEKLRRQKFREIQQRTQWVVAGAVFASPVPSTDLLSVAVVNGLMIKEMAGIWSCSWRSESLQVVARQLAGAALAQGVVEWSGQALLGVAKLHGSSWLAAGTLQALSAAYLTRVVGRSMADWMALNNGVAEPDLEALKRQAPQLVAIAAEQERVNWAGFLKQASNWINDRDLDPSFETSFVEVSITN